MSQHSPADWDQRAERRNGSGRRWSDDLKAHDDNLYAHAQLVDCLVQATIPLREAFEIRLRFVEVRVFAFTVVSAVILVLVSATAGVVLARILR